MTKKFKVIVDTNVWISFLIGQRLKSFQKLIVERKIILVITDQLLEEIKLVTSRPGIKKYFPHKQVIDLIELLKIIAENHVISVSPKICRDPKDDFLLGLIDQSGADYLITGDKDLLALNPYNSAIIIAPREFEKLYNKWT